MKKILIGTLASVTIVIVTAMYLIIGYGMAYLYTWLANGGNTALVATTLTSPLILAALCLVYKFDRELYPHQIPWLGGKLFWTCMIWALSPIIANQCSIIIDRLGLQPESDFLYQWRYTGIWLIPVIFISSHVGEILYADIATWLRRHMFKKHFARD